MSSPRRPTPTVARLAATWFRASRLTLEARWSPSPARRRELLDALRELEASLLEVRVAGGAWPTAQGIAAALALELHDDGPGAVGKAETETAAGETDAGLQGPAEAPAVRIPGRLQ